MPDLSFKDLNTESDENKGYMLFVAEFEVEKEDVFHLKNLYKMMQEWLDLNYFFSVDSDQGEDPRKRDKNIETLYFQRVLQDGKNEHHIWWRVHKIPRQNKYYKYYMKIDFQTLNMGSKEVTIRGEKIGTNKGDIIIRCKAYLMLDWKKHWRKHWFLKHVHRMFLQYAYKKEVDYLKTDLWLTTYKFQDVIKQYLSMKTPYDMSRPFHNEGGV